MTAPGGASGTLAAAADRLARALPGEVGAPGAAGACERMVEEAAALARSARDARSEPSDPVLGVLGRLAACLTVHRRHEPARRILGAALEAAEENPPGDGFLRAVLHDELAASLQVEGRTEEALEHARRAEAAGREACEPGDPRLLALFNNLGTVHKRVGDFLTAEVHFRRALELADARAPGPAGAAAALNLADMLRARGRLDEALPYAERGLRETEEACGSTSFETADAAADLASLLEELGRRGDAVRHQRRAAALYELGLGADHALTRTALRRLDEWEAADPPRRRP